MAAPNREEGCGGEASGGYQILGPISQNSSSSESSYDYPANALLLVPESLNSSEQLQAQANAPFEMTSRSHEARKVPQGELPTLDNGSLEPANCESFSSSEGDSSDPSTVTVVRQVARPKSRPADDGGGREVMEDEKLYITGNLVGNCPSIFCKTSTGPVSNGGFEDEGIYQGLVMTDKQKKNIGILPESIYMTTNLLQKGALIESISLLDAAPAVAVEVPEVPLPRSSPPIFARDTVVVADTMPKASLPKPPRRQRGIAMHDDDRDG